MRLAAFGPSPSRSQSPSGTSRPTGPLQQPASASAGAARSGHAAGDQHANVLTITFPISRSTAGTGVGSPRSGGVPLVQNAWDSPLFGPRVHRSTSSGVAPALSTRWVMPCWSVAHDATASAGSHQRMLMLVVRRYVLVTSSIEGSWRCSIRPSNPGRQHRDADGQPERQHHEAIGCQSAGNPRLGVLVDATRSGASQAPARGMLNSICWPSGDRP